ncbi:MAG: type II toxin-antitoxin system ParD family antitoxin [Betaproteobacteria bacterium]
MPTPDVVLSEHQHELVDTLVQSGPHQNAGEGLRERLRLIDDRERFEGAKLKALKRAALQGWTDLSAGHYTEVPAEGLEDFIGQLGRRAAKQVKTAT